MKGLAQTAYEAWSAGFMYAPPWDDLSTESQNRWLGVVKAILAEI